MARDKSRKADYMRVWHANNPKPLITKWCKRCKTKFKTKEKTALYCRPGCNTLKRMGKFCKYCGALYMCQRTDYARRIYCSRSCSGSAKTGEQALNWQGGKTTAADRLRSSKAYKRWRLAVFERDNFTCVECGDDTGGNLEADHIKPRSIYPELTLDITNGRTLCRPCHKNTDTWGKKLFTYRKTIS